MNRRNTAIKTTHKQTLIAAALIAALAATTTSRAEESEEAFAKATQNPIATALIGALAFVSTAAYAADAKKPNILFIAAAFS